MEYVNFGNTGLEVSRLCLGAATFVSRGGREAAQRVVDEAMDHGINFIDTADRYGAASPEGAGSSESMLGQVLEGKYDRLVICTKFWGKMGEPPNWHGGSRYHMMHAIEDSLKRLRTDHIDVYLLHRPDPNTPVEETLSTLDALVKQGKVRYIGVSNHYAWQMAHQLGVSALHNWEPIQVVQSQYNILNRFVEHEIAHFVRRFNLATMVYNPIAGGLLSGKYKRGEPAPEGSRYAADWGARFLTDLVFDVTEKLQVICEREGIAMHQLAYKWLLSKDFVTTPILGGNTPEQFRPMYDIFNIELDPAVYDEIDEISDACRFVPFVNQPEPEGARLAQNWW